MQELEDEISLTKDRLLEIRHERASQREALAISLEQCRNKEQWLHRCFRERLERKTELSHYFFAIKQVHFSDPHCTLPDSTSLRKQGLLTYYSHQIEVMRKAQQECIAQTEKLIQYMRCEIAVVEQEKEDIRNDFIQQKQAQKNGWNRIEAPLKHHVRVQENVINHIQSLLLLQQDIRSHSMMVQDDHYSSSSFGTLDFNESLSTVSATFVDSFRKLPDTMVTEPEKLVELLKQLLLIDGTFQTQPENEEFLEKSFKQSSFVAAA